MGNIIDSLNYVMYDLVEKVQRLRYEINVMQTRLGGAESDIARFGIILRRNTTSIHSNAQNIRDIHLLEEGRSNYSRNNDAYHTRSSYD